MPVNLREGPAMPDSKNQGPRVAQYRSQLHGLYGERVFFSPLYLRIFGYFLQNSSESTTLNAAFWSLATSINASWGFVISSLHSHWYALALPIPSASPASSSIRQEKEGRFFALLFKTLKKLLSLFAGFFVAGFFKGSEQINEIKNPTNPPLCLPYYVHIIIFCLWKKSPSSPTTAVPCSKGFWPFVTPVGREGNLLSSEKPKESLLSTFIPLGSTGHSPNGSRQNPTWSNINRKLPNHVFPPWCAVFPLSMSERLALSIMPFHIFLTYLFLCLEQ